VINELPLAETVDQEHHRGVVRDRAAIAVPTQAERIAYSPNAKRGANRRQ
jgi:hypothetical protein